MNGGYEVEGGGLVLTIADDDAHALANGVDGDLKC